MSEISKAEGHAPPQRERVPRFEYIRRQMEQDRQRNPHLYLMAPDGLGPNRLFVENVAAMLGCSVDYVRRISRSELPAATIGKRVVYARAAVEAYIDRRAEGSGSYCHVSARKPKGGAKQAVLSEVVVEAFDPVAILRKRGGAR